MVLYLVGNYSTLRYITTILNRLVKRKLLYISKQGYYIDGYINQ